VRLRVTWQYAPPPNSLRFSLYRSRLYPVGGTASGADFLAVIFFLFLIVKASGKVFLRRGLIAGFRGGKQQRLSQSRVWIHVQDSGAVGVTDGGNECAG
jgi:hypothetical protein